MKVNLKYSNFIEYFEDELKSLNLIQSKLDKVATYQRLHFKHDIAMTELILKLAKKEADDIKLIEKLINILNNETTNKAEILLDNLTIILMMPRVNKNDG